MRRCCAKQKQKPKCVWHTPRRSSRPATFLRLRFFFSPSPSAFSPLSLPSERKSKPETAEKEKIMKLEEIKNKTNEAVSYLVEALEKGQSEVLSEYLNAMARFHQYSFGNIMLIARQRPTATRVAGIRTWNLLGRFVRRGEKGILILAPMVGGENQQSDAVATEIATDNAADERKREAQLYGFRAVYVFDVSQTEGKELPSLTDVEGDVSGYRERLVEYVESKGIKLSYSEKIAPAKGLSSGKRITLLTGMQPAEEFSTLVHEMAHEMLHRSERRTLTNKEVRETEAEAVAFVVCQSIGLETGTASEDYIRLWNGSAKLLQESLEVVRRTASVILGGIVPKPAATIDGDAVANLQPSNTYASQPSMTAEAASVSAF